MYFLIDPHAPINLAAFFFGFEQSQFIFNERRDEGGHDILFSAAPGNATEKNFSFALNLKKVKGEFTFGSQLL